MSPTVSHRFRAMGTDVTLLSDEGVDPRAFSRAARIAELTFAREERRFSRFRGDSELSRVNERAGRWTAVSDGFATLLRLSLQGSRRSGGRFDPTVLPALVAAGYDRDFDEVLAGARGALNRPMPCGRWREVLVRDGRVHLPEGVGLDFGGVAKGRTADLAAEAAVHAAGLPWAVVNAGGDLRLSGDAPSPGITVRIEDPDDRTAELGRLTLRSGALASSSVTTRSWGPGLHHLIDPSTGVPAASEVLQATVWADTCAEAEIRSTWALLEGAAALRRFPGVLVTEDRVVMNLEMLKSVEVAA